MTSQLDASVFEDVHRSSFHPGTYNYTLFTKRHTPPVLSHQQQRHTAANSIRRNDPISEYLINPDDKTAVGFSGFLLEGFKQAAPSICCSTEFQWTKRHCESICWDWEQHVRERTLWGVTTDYCVNQYRTVKCDVKIMQLVGL